MELMEVKMSQTVRRVNKGKNTGGGRLWVPPRLATLIPPESRFEAELTEEGILFRRVDPEAALPTWATGS